MKPFALIAILVISTPSFAAPRCPGLFDTKPPVSFATKYLESFITIFRSGAADLASPVEAVQDNGFERLVELSNYARNPRPIDYDITPKAAANLLDIFDRFARNSQYTGSDSFYQILVSHFTVAGQEAPRLTTTLRAAVADAFARRAPLGLKMFLIEDARWPNQPIAKREALRSLLREAYRKAYGTPVDSEVLPTYFTNALRGSSRSLPEREKEFENGEAVQTLITVLKSADVFQLSDRRDTYFNYPAVTRQIQQLLQTNNDAVQAALNEPNHELLRELVDLAAKTRHG